MGKTFPESLPPPCLHLVAGIILRLRVGISEMGILFYLPRWLLEVKKLPLLMCPERRQARTDICEG